ncbi:hypothetical protein TB1_000901 [Malus domestica]
MASTLILNLIATSDRARDSSRMKKMKKIQPKQDQLHHQKPNPPQPRQVEVRGPASPYSSKPLPKPLLTRHSTLPPPPPTHLLLLPLHDVVEQFARPPIEFSLSQLKLSVRVPITGHEGNEKG